jgi:hypothetical protein
MYRAGMPTKQPNETQGRNKQGKNKETNEIKPKSIKAI